MSICNKLLEEQKDILVLILQIFVEKQPICQWDENLKIKEV